jgi:NHS family xanthosine MFS transporter
VGLYFLVGLFSLLAALLGLREAGRSADDSRALVAAFIVLFLGIGTCASTASSLVTASVLATLDHARQFAWVRGAGTLAFLLTSVWIGYVLPPVSPLCLWQAAGFAVALAILVRARPRAVDLREQAETTAHCRPPVFREVIHEVGWPLLLAGLSVASLQCFWVMLLNPFLLEAGVANPAAVQAWGQSLEVLLLLALPWLLRLPLRLLLVSGPAGWIGVYLACALTAGHDGGPVLRLGLALQGLNCLYQTIATLHIRSVTRPGSRATALALFTFIQGFGLAGNFGADGIVRACSVAGRTDWASVWFVPAALAILTTLFSLIFVGKRQATRRPTPSR